MALSGSEFRIGFEDQQVRIAEVGGLLRAYTVGDVPVTPTFGDDVLPPKCIGTPLLPWPNRIRGGHYTFDGQEQQLALTDPANGNAIHGLARWERWVPLDVEDSTLTMGYDVVPQKGYPFQIHAQVSYRLDDDGLTVTMTATNTGTETAPFGAGMHPYLSTRGVPLDQVELDVPVDERIVVDDAGIPVGAEPVSGTPYALDGSPLGERRFDAGYRAVRFRHGRARATLRAPWGEAVLWWDEAFGYVQVFTVPGMDATGDAVAIEPMSCPADAFNSGEGLIRLEPTRSWTGHWGIRPNG